MHHPSKPAGALLFVLALASPLSADAGKRRDAQKPFLGSWSYMSAREGCDDRSEAHAGETWTFSEDGSFVRVAPKAGLEERGTWKVQHDGRLLRIAIVADGDGDGVTEEREERYAVLEADGKSLQVLAPTQLEQGVVVQRERFSAFFHS